MSKDHLETAPSPAVALLQQLWHLQQLQSEALLQQLRHLQQLQSEALAQLECSIESGEVQESAAEQHTEQSAQPNRQSCSSEQSCSDGGNAALQLTNHGRCSFYELQTVARSRTVDQAMNGRNSNIHHRHKLRELPSIEMDVVARATLLSRIVRHQSFDLAVCIVIGLDMVLSATEVQFARDGTPVPTAVVIMNWCILGGYIIELTIRLLVYGVKLLWMCRWIQFDIILVVSGVAYAVVDTVALARGLNWVRVATPARVLRVLRIARVLRVYSHFGRLWAVVKNLVDTLAALSWTMVAASILCFFFSIIGVDLIRPDQDDDRYNVLAENNFGTIWLAMATLVQTLLLDDSSEVYMHQMKTRPVLAVFWYLFIFVGSVALMNVVAAVVVDTALQHSQQERDAVKEAERKQKSDIIDGARSLFREIDLDNSGQLTMTDIKAGTARALEMLVGVTDIIDLEMMFEAFDSNRDGTIDISEFCTNIMRLTEGTPMELLCCVQVCRDIRANAKDMKLMLETLVHLAQEARILTSCVAKPKDSLSQPLSGRKLSTVMCL